MKANNAQNFFFIPFMESGVSLHPIGKIIKTDGKFKTNYNSWYAELYAAGKGLGTKSATYS